MTALLKTGTSLAHVSVGRWCAFCSNPYCDSATEFESVKPPILPVFSSGFQCVACGYLTEVIWPEPRKFAAIERLLSLRPNPNSRNWGVLAARCGLPEETITQLQYENGLNGIYDHLKSLPVDANPMVVTDDEILVDNLPALTSGGWSKSLGQRQ